MASKAAAFQALDRLDTIRLMHFKQRFVVAEEGIQSNKSFLFISNDSMAINHRILCHMNYFLWSPLRDARYAENYYLYELFNLATH